MIRRTLRVIFGLILAYVAAGLTLVLFVYTPRELAGDLSTDRLSEAAVLALAVATHGARYTAWLALVCTGLGEVSGIRSWLYYVFGGLVVAGTGFLAFFWPEAASTTAAQVNTYVIAAFCITGLVGGNVYWLFSGRFAGARPIEPTEIMPPHRTPPQDATPARVET